MTAIELYNHGAENANTYLSDIKADEVGDAGSPDRVLNQEKNLNNGNELEMESKGRADAINNESESNTASELATTGNVLLLPSDDAVSIPMKRKMRQTLMSCFGCSS